MSPSEIDLRAALHDGEGEGLDVNGVIARGQARRAHRRTVVLSAAAVVIVVGAVSGGVAALSGGGASSRADREAPANGGISGLEATAGSAGGGGAAAGAASPSAAGQASRNQTNATGSNAPTAAPGVPCPTSLPRYLLPGGGSPGQFGSDGPLFDRPVATIVVCSYGTPQQAVALTPSSGAGRLVLTGDDATGLAASLENSAKTKLDRPCPAIRGVDQRALAIIGVDAKGARISTVTATLSPTACNTQATNGTAVRYDWQPPSDLVPTLRALTPHRPGLTAGPGAPARS
jgi:hypothetical protein